MRVREPAHGLLKYGFIHIEGMNEGKMTGYDMLWFDFVH
jgi:hypothetical protein